MAGELELAPEKVMVTTCGVPEESVTVIVKGGVPDAKVGEEVTTEVTVEGRAPPKGVNVTTCGDPEASVTVMVNGDVPRPVAGDNV